jgi:hypothetical protein
MNHDTEYLSTPAAVTFLRNLGVIITEGALANRRYQRQPPTFYRVAGRVLYHPDDLRAYVASCRVDPVADAKAVGK